MSLLNRIRWKLFERRLKPLRRGPDGNADWHGDQYWEKRRNMNYYREVVRLAEKYEPEARSAIDVGGYTTRVIHQMDWIPNRVLLDTRRVPTGPEVEVIRADFFAYEPAACFDLVICLQVLEHLTNPSAFAHKLLATGRTVVLSVPYRWPGGASKNHIQDPVDEEKVRSWTGCDPLESLIVADRNSERWVGIYRREIRINCRIQDRGCAIPRSEQEREGE
jgi:hypothetical protein